MSNYSVYVLTAPNGKKYIGMTMQKPKYRWNGGKGYKNNAPLYSDIILHGWENFHKTIYSDGLTLDEACRIERELIARYKTQNEKYGYNVEDGGVITRLSEQTRQKMSDAHKGKERSEEYRRNISESKRGSKNGMYKKYGAQNPNARKVTATGNGQIREYDSISGACREMNLSKNAFKNISACCTGKRKTAYGYVWRYAEQ